MRRRRCLPVELNLADELLAPLEQLWRQGYVRLEDGIFSADEIALFRSESDRLMAQVHPWSERHANYGPTDYMLPVFGDRDWSVLINLAGRSAAIDRMLEKLFTHPRITALLEAIMGPGYKAWEISIRRSNAHDDGLRLHQDAQGEFGLSMLLLDNPGATGTTVFTPGSHRFPISARESGADYLAPKYMSRFVQPASGKAGDIFLFFKKTWHGRLPSRAPQPSDALLMGLFPVGYQFLPFRPEAATLQALGPELQRLLDPARQLQAVAERRCIVTDTAGSTTYDGPPRLIDHLYQPAPLLHPLRAAKLLGKSLDATHRLVKTVRAMKKRNSASL